MPKSPQDKRSNVQNIDIIVLTFNYQPQAVAYLHTDSYSGRECQWRHFHYVSATYLLVTFFLNIFIIHKITRSLGRGWVQSALRPDLVKKSKSNTLWSLFGHAIHSPIVSGLALWLNTSLKGKNCILETFYWAIYQADSEIVFFGTQ